MNSVRSKKKTVQNQLLSNYRSNIHKLEYFNFNIVDGCNSRCTICYLWKNHIQKLSFTQFCKVIKLMEPYMVSDKEIVLNLGGGGEPLLNNEIFKMIKFSKNCGFLTSLVTNSLLLTKKTCENLVNSGLDFINLSFESFDNKINDKIRGVKGHHKKVLGSIKYLTNAKEKYNSSMRIGILTTICSHNLESIPDLIKWVDKTKEISTIRLHSVTQVFGSNSIKEWYKKKEFSHLWPKEKSIIENTYDQISKIKKKGSKVENSFQSLMTQKNYFLYPNKNNPYIRQKCEVHKGVIINANGQLVLCPMGENILIPFGKNIILDLNEKQYNPINLLNNIKKTQKKIINCTFNNCHIKLNCNFSGNEQYNFE